MKIAFDEHIPPGMVRVFEALIAERKMRALIGASGRGKQGGYSIVASRAYNPSPDDADYIKGSDAPWIDRFAQDGGKVIISGNVNMMAVPQEVLALQRAGMVTLFFESKWNNWDFFQKSSLLLWHWECVVNAIKAADRGDVYRIPSSFSREPKIDLVSRAGQLELLIGAGSGQELKRVRKKLTRKDRPGSRKTASQDELQLPAPSGTPSSDD